MESAGVGLLHCKPGTGRELQKRGCENKKRFFVQGIWRRKKNRKKKKENRPRIGSEVNSLVFRVSSDQRLLSSVC